jgi:hypothetical protein|tara:strand:- start:53 stop:259 length:207 start_codon:yes stop_codon:yes gene_type:complete
MSLEIKPAFENNLKLLNKRFEGFTSSEELELMNKRNTAELLQKSKERKIASDKKKRQLENKKWWQFWI